METTDISKHRVFVKFSFFLNKHIQTYSVETVRILEEVYKDNAMKNKDKIKSTKMLLF